MILIFFVSCSKDEIQFSESNSDSFPVAHSTTYYEGVKLKNPYTVANMQKAYDSLQLRIADGSYTATTDIVSRLHIQATHKYVKFSPQNETELNRLKEDSTLILFDYPLDYEYPDIFWENRYSEDSTLVADYYTSIPVTKSIPEDVNHTIIDDLYIPEQDPQLNDLIEYPLTRESQMNNKEDVLHHLLYEAFKLTDNLDEIMVPGEGFIDDPYSTSRFWIFGRRWRPSGRIQYWDQLAGTTIAENVDCEDTFEVDYSGCYDNDGTFTDCPEYIFDQVCTTTTEVAFGAGHAPLRGAQVLMRQWFTIDSGITDENGEFTTGTVRGKARYLVQWERYHYSIRRGLVFQAAMRGPKVKNRAWYKNIGENDDKDNYHAAIHNAALHYYYGNRLGTKNPPYNGVGKKQMKIAAFLGSGGSAHVPIGTAATGFLPQIYLNAYQVRTDFTFGETIHELAHAAHRNLDFYSYSEMVLQGYTLPCGGFPCALNNETNRRARRTLETWAKTVEIALTRDYYINYLNIPEADYIYRNDNYQDEEFAPDDYYTSAGWDMIDDLNQRFDLDEFDPALPNDNVANYTLSELEDGLEGAQTWIQWRNNIAERIINPTEGNLPELFDQWQ